MLSYCLKAVHFINWKTNNSMTVLYSRVWCVRLSTSNLVIAHARLLSYYTLEFISLSIVFVFSLFSTAAFKFLLFSGTERHRNSFLPRAIGLWSWINLLLLLLFFFANTDRYFYIIFVCYIHILTALWSFSYSRFFVLRQALAVWLLELCS